MPWIMRQSWRDLLFAHWPVEVSVLRPLVPPQLTLEEHGGTAWIGLTPFVMKGVRPRMLPPVPGASRFPEMNLRTYVRADGVPGIFFFSLDAANPLAVAGARLFYRLPYYRAEMQVEQRDGWIHYRSSRVRGGGAELAARYRPVGDTFHARRGSLEHFLVERYSLFTVLRSGRVLRGDIRHPPWPLRAAEGQLARNTVAAAAGVALPDEAPLLHFSGRQDVVVWPPRLVQRDDAAA